MRSKHWLSSRHLLCVLLLGLCAASAGAQCPSGTVTFSSIASVGKGPVRLTISANAPVANVPKGCSTKLNIFASSLQTVRPTSSIPPATGARNVSSDMVWRSSDTTAFIVSSHGQVTAVNTTGGATITATGWQGEFSVALTAAPAVLVGIAVTPFDNNVGVAGNINYSAVGIYSDGSSQPFSAPLTWTANSYAGGGQATIIPTGIATAKATGVAVGVVQITATNGSLSGSTFLNVGLSTIAIVPTIPPPNPTPPPDASVPKGDTQTFAATGHFSSGPDLDITNYVAWRSSTQLVARVSTAGIGTSTTGGIGHTFSLGTTNVNAVSGGALVITSNTLVLQVTHAVVNTLTIYPGCPTSVPRGTTCQFQAIGIYSDNTEANLTDSSNWSATGVNCVSITATTGFATTMALPAPPPSCTSTITASYPNVYPPFNNVGSNPINLTVNPAVLRNVTITPNHPTVAKGNQQPFGIVEHWTDGNQIKAGSTCPSWTSSSPSVATIVPGTGLATAVNPGTTTIGFGSNCLGFQPSTVMTVIPAQLQSITVAAISPEPLTPPDPSNTTIPVAAKQDFMATGNYTDGSHNDITDTVNWTTSNAGVASMSDPTDPNEATGVAAGGPVTITATDPSTAINGTASLVVKLISFITVSPSAPQMLSPGGTAQFTATANYPGPATQVLTNFGPTWSSSPTSVATVDQNGIATAVGPGSATITATMGTFSCPTGGGNCGSVMVSAAVLQSITISCDPSDPCQTSGGDTLLSLGKTEQMIATGHYSDNSTQDLTADPHLTWDTTNHAVAIFNLTDPPGFLTTKGLGSANVTATCSSMCPGAQSTVTGTLPLTVTF